jgi:hypothetical protein
MSEGHFKVEVGIGEDRILRVGCYPIRRGAIGAAQEFTGMSDKEVRRLRREDYMELDPGKHAAEFVRIVPCECQLMEVTGE